MIIPGDKNLGLIRYKDVLYSFSTLQNALEFIKCPDEYNIEIVNLAKTHADYIQLLHLYKYFPTVEALEKTRSFTRQRLLGRKPIVSEAGCQVETHLNESHIDTKYHWNEWDHRREALMLVNLKDKKTHSCQTDESHFRRESETQNYIQKQQYTQTMRTMSSNVPKSVIYYKGLRNDGKGLPKGIYEPYGTKHYNFKAVDLTIDHDGKPVPYTLNSVNT
jgi:hypothetical protein